ncbi:MAG: tRNA (adenosine(37)-N6)-threonylcarbamoyltransferase complex ATPase subunit type 1 TsaE [Acidimicrobiales bacterium]
MIRCVTASVDETRDLAAEIAPLCQERDLLVLAGELGAGKTVFAQGFGRGLGVDVPVTSPTFTLANRYEGRLVLDHLDVYRFEQLAEVRDLGLAELLDEGVTLVEWGDTIAPVLPNERLDVRLAFGPGDDDRVIELVPDGARWRSRARRLEAVVAPWCDRGGEPC